MRPWPGFSDLIIDKANWSCTGKEGLIWAALEWVDLGVRISLLGIQTFGYCLIIFWWHNRWLTPFASSTTSLPTPKSCREKAPSPHHSTILLKKSLPAAYSNTHHSRVVVKQSSTPIVKLTSIKKAFDAVFVARSRNCRLTMHSISRRTSCHMSLCRRIAPFNFDLALRWVTIVTVTWW